MSKMTPEQRQQLKDFAATPLNKSVMLLAMQGCTARQIAANLSVGQGTAIAVIHAANDLLGNGGEISASTLGESLRAMQQQRRTAQ